jgi:hypothetical protein
MFCRKASTFYFFINRSNFSKPLFWQDKYDFLSHIYLPWLWHILRSLSEFLSLLRPECACTAFAAAAQTQGEFHGQVSHLFLLV